MVDIISKKDLEKYYISENHSIKDSAVFFGVSVSSIKKLLKNYGIKKELESVKALKKETCNKKYGGNAPSCSADVVNKMKTTKEEKYGDSGYNNIKKIKETNLNKYGVENISQASVYKDNIESIREKAKETCIEKYGTEKYWLNNSTQEKAKQGREKARETCLKKYGTEYYSQSEKFKRLQKERTEKTRKTCLEKYGVINVSLVDEISLKKHFVYKYDGIVFDSSWELALWIYCKDHGEEIERNPIKYEYFFEDKKYYYIPDFKYKGKIIEIKGPQFFEGDKMICPFNRKLDGLFEAKHTCMKKYGVEIWGKKELDFVLNYIKESYGIKYLQEYRYKK